MASLAKLFALSAELGWPNAILYVIGLVFARLNLGIRVVRYYIVAQPVSGQPILPPRRGRSIVVKQVFEGDPAFDQLPLTLDVIQYRFAQQAICFVAFKDDLVVGCLWLCLDGYDEDEIRCRFVPVPENRTAWDFDVYVHPEQRTGIAFARLWDEANAFLREKGVGWSVSRISAFNVRSLDSHRSLGAFPYASVTAICARRWQICFASVTPRVHFSRGVGSKPVYRLAVKHMRHHGFKID